MSEEGFLSEVERLRGIGFKKITLKTGAYGLRELAMGINWSSKARIDLLTIDGSGGGTGDEPLEVDGGMGHAANLSPFSSL